MPAKRKSAAVCRLPLFHQPLDSMTPINTTLTMVWLRSSLRMTAVQARSRWRTAVNDSNECMRTGDDDMCVEHNDDMALTTARLGCLANE